MRPLPDDPVFTHVDAHRAGVSTSALRHAVATGRIVRVSRGLYAHAWPVDHADLAVATARLHPDEVVSHRSAAAVRGLPLLHPPPRDVDVTVPPRAGGNRPHRHVHRATLLPRDVGLCRGVQVAGAARTAIDVARNTDLAGGVVLIDAVRQRRLADADDLDDVVLRCWNWPGIGRAQRALRLSDGLAESPLESLSRLAFGFLGLPAPRSQVVIRDRAGRFVGRSDFYWDEFGVVGEADGRSKYDERVVLTAEKERQERLENLGLVVVRWQWEHATSAVHVLGRRLRLGFDRGRARDRSGFPRLWTL